MDKNYFDRMDRDQLIHWLANQRLHVADCKRALDQATAAEKMVRETLTAKMNEEGARTVEGYGLQVVLQRRDKIEIADEAAIRKHLIGLGLLDAYTRLDVTPVKKDGAKLGWPGVSRETVDTLVVRELKEEPVAEAAEGA